MIRQIVELYIGGQKLDLSNNGGIYLNYKQKDAKNPTVVKNMFSKTLEIPGTDNNNNIFNNIWELTRVQTTSIYPYFNQSKRVDFQLFIDGELIEEGYCKLDSIKRDGPNISFSLSLFGSLGDFFYSLSYDSNTGEKKTLASLDFGQDISFTINKETVKDEWDALSSGVQHTISFAPCYNGIPDVLDAGKTLIYTYNYDGTIRFNKGNGWEEQQHFITSINNGEYHTLNGYTLAEGEELTEWQHRDIRSYLQRPVLHIPALFDAICNPANNGSYEVELDPDFFSSGNSFYQQAYITLPMISEMDANKVESSSTITTVVQASVGSSTSETNTRIEMEDGWDRYDLTCTLIAYSNETSADYLYTSHKVRSTSNYYYLLGGFGMQLIGLDRNGNEVVGSNIVWLTTPIDGLTAKYENVKQGYTSRLLKTDKVDTYLGSFVHTDVGTYMWNDTSLSFTLDTNVKLSGFRMRIVPGAIVTKHVDISSRIGKVWDNMVSTSLPEGYEFAFNLASVSSVGTTVKDTPSYSDVTVTQDMLLNTKHTPAEYLLAYCKLFNLYFDKDVYDKKVKILCQKNFYDKDVNISDDIHNVFEIKPMSFDHKWYSFNYADGDGEMLEAYKKKYATDYGQQRVNTGYEFDNETEELLKDNILRNAVDVLPANKYFIDVKDTNNVELPIFLRDYVTYHLYNDDFDSTDITMGLSRTGSYSSINTKSTEAIQYDSISKVQFQDENKPTDGSDVLLFFNGMKTVPVDYLITDDLGVMFQLNEKATWLWTANEYDSGGSHIAIKTNSLPQFSRYIMDDDNIYASWDFGRVKELYIPEIAYLDGDTTIYERYWRTYINDLYDIDTRIVTAYIKFDEKPTKESLKHFYYFENSYWVIDEIIDYNPTSYELTKVKFVKVNDKANYLNNNIVPPGPGPEPPVVKQFEFNPEGIMVNAGSGSTSTTLLVSGYEVIEWTIPTQSWYTITRNGNTVSITYTANPDTTDRSFSIGVAGRDGSEIVTTIYNFLQKGVVIPDTVSITAPSPIAATATTLTYSVTASKNVDVELLPDHTTNRHNSGTTLGSFTIPANTAATAQYYSVVASLVDDPTITDAASITQDGVGVYVTGITLSSTWATDVPYTGGTATYQNCNNVVTAYYSDGTSADITSSADFSLSTSLNVSATTATTRESVGVISVIASYYDGPNPFTSTVVVTAYQQAYVPPIPTVTWQAYNRSEEWNVYGNLHTGSTQDYAGLELHTGETEDHSEAVPATLTSAYLALSPAPQNPENYSIVLSNSTYGDAMTCTYDSVNGAWVGTGSVRLEQGTVLDIAVVQTNSRGTVQEEPDEEPDADE